MSIKHELQNIISRNGFVRNGKNIQTITNYLRGKKEAVSNLKEGKFTKNEETKILIDLAHVGVITNIEFIASLDKRRESER